MITYDNKQSAFRLILQLSGSVFPRAVPAGLVAAGIALCLGLDALPFFQPTIDHSFAVQIFAIVLGYVIVFRTNMALGRYREGITSVEIMVSKWADAFMQINAFINVRLRTAKGDSELESKLRSLRLDVLHWFSLLSGIAMNELQNREIDLVNGFDYRPFEKTKHLGRRTFLLGRHLGRNTAPRRGSLLMPRASVMMLHPRGHSPSSSVTAYNISRLAVLGECSSEEVRRLDVCTSKGMVVARWINEAVSRSCLDAIITVPPPILSRCYQEISNGMLGFNQAFKVTLVPFPFPFAQLMALLLLVFIIICPIMVVKMTVGKILSPILSFFAVLGYWGLNQIAVELENPFGDDENDLPLEHVHTAFVDGIHDCAFAGLAETEFTKTKKKPEESSLISSSVGHKPSMRARAACDPLLLDLNRELSSKWGASRESLFSTRLKFRDLLLFRYDDLKRRFSSDRMAREVLSRIRILAKKQGAASPRPLILRAIQEQSSSNGRRQSQASSLSSGSRVHFE